jgi:hypothetical protein
MVYECMVYECMVYECMVYECMVYECMVYECMVYEEMRPVRGAYRLKGTACKNPRLRHRELLRVIRVVATGT